MNKKDISINVGSGVPKSDINLDIENNTQSIELPDGRIINKVDTYSINDKFILNEVNNKTHWNKPFFKG
jgi:hypothetical protein